MIDIPERRRVHIHIVPVKLANQFGLGLVDLGLVLEQFARHLQRRNIALRRGSRMVQMTDNDTSKQIGKEGG
jgi:hypothetical protein